MESQAPHLLNELKNLPNDPSDQQEILNIDAILGKRLKLKELKGGIELFNELFISTLEHKISEARRTEWSFMLVDGQVNDGEKVPKFVAFIERIRDAHFKRKESDAMKVTPSKPKGQTPGEKPKKMGKQEGENSQEREKPKAAGNNAQINTTKCAICAKEHRTHTCDEIKEAQSDKIKLGKLHQKMQAKRVCTRCLRKKKETDDEHPAKCSHTFKGQNGKTLNFDCKTGCNPHSPNMGINYLVCFCKAKADTKSNKSNAKRNIRQAIVNVSKTNDCGIGESILAMETIEVSTKQGGWIKILLQYDNGAQNSLLTTRLANRAAWASEKADYTVSTISGNASSDQKVHTILVKEQNGQVLEVGGLGISEKAQTYTSKTIPLPKSWHQKYGIKSFTTPAGHLEMLIGQDGLRFFPEKVDETDGADIQLCRSKITGNFLIMGNPERAGLGKPKPAQPNGKGISTSNKVTINPIVNTEARKPPKTIRFSNKDEQLLKIHSHESVEINTPITPGKTQQEIFEEKLQKTKIERTETGIAGDYLWIHEILKQLPTNEKTSLISQENLENKLRKLGPESIEAFNANMEDGFKYGAYR